MRSVRGRANESTEAAERISGNDSRRSRERSLTTDRHRPSRDAVYSTVSSSISSGVGSGRGIAAGVRDNVGDGDSADEGRRRPTTVPSYEG